jgi:hypothetical protein
MRYRALVFAAALGLMTTAASAGEFLTAERLKTELGGFTIKGFYTADKVNFVEVYLPDGRITYKDDLKGDVGKWSVRGMAFCTFYNSIGGGCWYVVKKSANCFEFYIAPDSGAAISREDLDARQPQALAARDSDKVTCSAWFGA